MSLMERVELATYFLLRVRLQARIMKEDPSFTEVSALDVTDDPSVEPQPSEEILEDYRRRYGLAADPFGPDPYFPFFTGGQRRELLDQIVHICQFGQGIPLVLGERGVGKTRLLLAIHEALGDDTTCVINALPTLRQNLLSRQVAQHFDLALPTDTLEDLYQETVASDSGPFFVLIDNAQDLDDQTLSDLMSMERDAEGNGLRFALFGDLALAARVQEFFSSLPVIELYIERFTLRETVDYLNYRMEVADYLGPEIFTEAKVEPWWRRAQGQLTIIHRLAQEHLLETVLPPLKSGAKPFPVMHILAIAILGGVGLMTFLYSGGKDEQERTQQVPISIPPSAVAPAPQEAIAEATVPDGSVSDDSLLDSSELDNSVLEQDLTAATADASMPAVQAQSSTAANVSSVAPEPVVAPPAAATSEPPVNSSMPAAAAPAVSAERPYTRDEETLLSWRQADFTLQLLGVSTEKAAKEFIAAQPNRDDLLMFRTVRQGKPWFVVVAGRYASAVEARKAITSLPVEQVKAGPWSRGLKGIQEEIQR